jgi:HAMP domain-containing protein
VRFKAMDEAEGSLAELMAMASKPVAPRQMCDAVRKVTNTAFVYDRFVRGFNDPEVFVLVRGRVLTGPLSMLERVADQECDGKPDAEINVKRLAGTAERALYRLTRAFAEMIKFEPSVYQPQSVLDFKPFDLRALDMKNWLAFGFEQSSALRNSSTNFNRKRGAYMLKRFFCDDLTPVGFESPKEHVSGAHGSDTTCYNCHYKLDPMAGFFRDRGANFADFSRQDELLFDDLAGVDREKYETAWHAPKGSARDWNIGYIRSPRFEDQNLYGQSLADLSVIIRKAPEAKQCLVRRMHEYFVADNQTMDGGYLEDFTRTFATEAAENSSTAMKNAIVRIVLSRTYHEPNADPQQCYDVAPGSRRENAPPCRVAFILLKNCAQCHGAGGNANLDLTSWILAPDGRSHTFPHLDSDRKQRAPQDTLGRIAERLSSTDPARRMPMQMTMDGRDRQDLFLWAQQELERSAKGQRP